MAGPQSQGPSPLSAPLHPPSGHVMHVLCGFAEFWNAPVAPWPQDSHDSQWPCFPHVPCGSWLSVCALYVS